MKGQQAEIDQLLGGTALETGSKNCAIPRGKWQLDVGATSSQNYVIPIGK